MKRLTADLARVCEAQVKLFEPRSRRAPFARYTFLTLAFGDGYGGLEHRNSTALICKREGMPFVGMKDSTEAYRSFSAWPATSISMPGTSSASAPRTSFRTT
jgi:predicted metalloprotease with PDZ domain